ncbi:MAG: 2-C-methyl-D-erythritol 4-phosphate cytidylyltransferase [Bacteroides sp.]|nr:2-C-methyl-D-erythritol 4-phosphate cytidylyltransferase [Bacteroides sp.]
MKKYALIVAGGKGLRMGSDLPKQFLPIGTGKVVLMHTLEAFYQCDPLIEIILILPADQQDYWKELCRKYNFHIPHSIVEGGETRFHSVKNGLSKIDEGGLIAVHDGVRPLVAKEVISNCYEKASQYQAVIPIIDIVETIRLITDDENKTVNRDNYKLVQTPQVFDVQLLKKAYEQEYTSFFTDDASVVESLGYSVHLTEGNKENIKITTPFDLKIAAALLS